MTAYPRSATITSTDSYNFSISTTCFHGSIPYAFRIFSCITTTSGSNIRIFTVDRCRDLFSFRRGSTCINECRPFFLVCTKFSYRSFDTTEQFNGFRNLATGDVVVVCRNGESSQNTDDGDNDHQFDKGEAFLQFFHEIYSIRFSGLNYSIRCGCNSVCCCEGICFGCAIVIVFFVFIRLHFVFLLCTGKAKFFAGLLDHARTVFWTRGLPFSVGFVDSRRLASFSDEIVRLGAYIAGIVAPPLQASYGKVRLYLV